MMGRPSAWSAFAFESTFRVADSAIAAMRGEIRVFSVTPHSVTAGRCSGGSGPAGSALQPVMSDLDWCAVVEICQAFLCPFLAKQSKVNCKRSLCDFVPEARFVPKGGGSIGRAAVSKTAGCRFESCPPCSLVHASVNQHKVE